MLVPFISSFGTVVTNRSKLLPIGSMNGRYLLIPRITSFDERRGKERSQRRGSLPPAPAPTRRGPHTPPDTHRARRYGYATNRNESHHRSPHPPTYEVTTDQGNALYDDDDDDDDDDDGGDAARPVLHQCATARGPARETSSSPSPSSSLAPPARFRLR